MNAPSQEPRTPLPVPLARELDRVSDRFEKAWREGHRPRLEDFLGDAPEPLRSALLRELVRLDGYYRRRAGERPTAEEYQGRFPADAELVRAVFAREGQAVPSPPPAPPSRLPAEALAAGEPPTADHRPDTPLLAPPSPEAGPPPALPARAGRYELKE